MIATDRAELDPLCEGDADEMVSVLADASLYEFTGGEPPALDSLRDQYRHQAAGSGDPDELWFNWIIRTELDRRAVGFVQATVTGRSADIAWVVGVRDQGNGLASEAAIAVRGWLVDNDVCRIEAHIHPQHVASHTVAARIALVRTGAVDDEGEEIWASGTILEPSESPSSRPAR